jgi:hypothetical protein
MAQLWSQMDNQWGLAPLEPAAWVLTGDASRPVRALGARPAGPGDVVLRCLAGADDDAWLLLAHGGRRDVRVNGLPLVGGLRELRDRDGIRFAGQQLYLSTERRARPVPFTGTGAPVFCARSRREIRPGDLAVRCPNPRCGAWHLQSEEFPCWTYGDTCAVCDQPTPLDAEFRWTPERL